MKRAHIGLAVAAIAATIPPVVSAPDAKETAPSLDMPRAALGNGSRGHYGNNKAQSRKLARRRRRNKEAKRSRRINRSRS